MDLAGFATGAGQALTGYNQESNAIAQQKQNALLQALNAIKVKQAQTQSAAQDASGGLLSYFANPRTATQQPTITGFAATPPTNGPNLTPMAQTNSTPPVSGVPSAGASPAPVQSPSGAGGQQITLQGLAQAVQKMNLPPAVAWQVFETAYPKFDDQSKLQFQQMREMREQQYRQAQETHMQNQDAAAGQRADTYDTAVAKRGTTATAKLDPVDVTNLRIAESDLKDAEAELRSVRNGIANGTAKADDLVKQSELVNRARQKRNEVQQRIQKKKASAPTEDLPTDGTEVLQQARDAIAQGAPRDAVIQKLKDMGVDASGL